MTNSEKIKSYESDITKLETMKLILNNTENLCGAMYSDIIESIEQTKKDLKRIIENLVSMK